MIEDASQPGVETRKPLLSAEPVLVLLAVSVALVAAWPAFVDLAGKWASSEAYSHGFVLLLVAFYMAAQRLSELPPDSDGSLWFLPIQVVSLSLVLIASLSELHVVGQYGFVGFIASLLMAAGGWRAIAVAIVPLCLLVLAVPMPGFIELTLTAELKRLSSQVGTDLLRVVGVPAFNEGNIIDLGTFQLQVADACSGLNYLTPLVATSIVIAGFLRTSIWRKVALAIVTVPLAVGMNALRIAITGVLFRHFGQESASGFLHYVEGWIVFACSLALLIPLAALLLRTGPDRSTLRDALVVDLTLPRRPQGFGSISSRRRLCVGIALALLTLVAASALHGRQKEIPSRSEFAYFPRLVGDWFGQHHVLDDTSLEVLNLTDYLHASYRSSQYTQPVDVLTTWYSTQTDGATPHSPSACLPGAGWEIVQLERTTVRLSNGVEVPLNRAMLERGGDRMLAYYWFQQRGRLFANEFLMKWYILQDSLGMNRVDGGMVRLTTRIEGGLEDGDTRLQHFMLSIWPVLPEFLPG